MGRMPFLWFTLSILYPMPRTLRLTPFPRNPLNYEDSVMQINPQFWNDLGEEIALYLRRYGVRLFRVDQ
jgi:glycosidase